MSPFFFRNPPPTRRPRGKSASKDRTTASQRQQIGDMKAVEPPAAMHIDTVLEPKIPGDRYTLDRNNPACISNP